MKKIVSLLLVMFMLASTACAEEGETVVPGNRLGFEALRVLNDGTQNRVFSPVSLAYALAMAAQGAEGETKQEIIDVLDGDPADVAAMTEVLAEAGQKLANAGFVAGDITFEEAYVDALREQFGAEWFADGKNVEKQINKWVKKHTDGLVEKMVEGELPEEAQLVLLNAIAMDAKWARPFSAEATSEDVFHTADGDVTVDFMHKRGWMEYGERDGVQLLKLHYLNEAEDALSGLSMLIALPEVGGVSDVLNGLCAEGINYFAFGEEDCEVILSMPKMDISADNSLNDVLKALGVENAFSDEADFSGMTKDEPLRIGGVKQKARLIVDEEGTKAAAATMVVMATSAMRPSEPVEFNMNRPFVVVIADEVSGAVCFAGIIVNPAAN